MVITGTAPMQATHIATKDVIRRVVICCFVIFATGLGDSVETKAQALADSSSFGDLFEQAFDVSEPLDGAVQLVEELETLTHERLDLNSSSAAQLAQIPGFDRLFVTSVLRHRETHGPFESVDDLRFVEGLPEELIDRIRPFLQVSSGHGGRLPQRGLSLEILQRIGSRVSDEATEASEGSSGTLAAQSVYTRLRGRLQNRWTFNLTMEKDAGEVFVWNQQKGRFGFDHVSSFVSMETSGIIRRLVIGDFTVNAGQGLTLWRGGSFGKGRDPVRLIGRNGNGIVPYGSTDENRFFRGTAATVNVSDRIAVSVFASRRRLDAVVADFNSGHNPNGHRAITSFPNTGYHRSQAELDHRDAVREALVGAIASITFRDGQVGFTGYRSDFSLPVKQSDTPSGKYSFSGKTASSFSLYADYVAGGFLFFGEGGSGTSSRPAGLAGVQYRLPHLFDLVVHARYYPREFICLHGRPFSVQSTARNETGYYVGIRFTPSRSWTFSGYFDQYVFPWLRYQVSQPSEGYESFASATYAPRKWLKVYFHGTTKAYARAVQTTDAAGRQLKKILTDHRSVFRAQFDYSHSDRLELSTRMDVTRYLTPEGDRLSYGLLLFQDLRYSRARFSFSARYAIFDSDSYGARLYMHERDLMNMLSFPVLTDKGDRYYVMGSYSITSKLKFQLKWAETRTIVSPHERDCRKEIRFMIQARI